MLETATPIMIREEKSIYLVKPTVEDLKNAVRELCQSMGYDKPFPFQKIHVKFMHDVEIRVNRRQVKKLREAKLKFFESQQNNYCYTFNRRTGYPVNLYLPVSEIYSLTIYGEKTDDERKKELQSFLNKFHPNAWEDMRRDLAENPDKAKEYPYNNLKTLNISKNFDSYVIEQLKRAFEEKRPYNHKKYGDKRDLSVSVEIGADGKLRAWYSNEFAGCGNGSYYILINPTTAALREDD